MATRRRIVQQQQPIISSANILEKKYAKQTVHTYDYQILAYAISLTAARIFAALQCPIMDCDEVFNYWEPLHLLFHGSGLQTWEYSPKYAIRSYAFLLVFTPVLKLCEMFALSKRKEFYVLRTCFALCSALADICLANFLQRAFCRRLANYMRWMQIFATGMFISSPALLPSSVAMTLTTYAYAFWLINSDFSAIFCIGLSTLLCWPFAGLLGVPIALEMMVRRCFRKLVFGTLLSAALILSYMVPIDSYFYGKTVVAPLNIVLYNVFNAYGPELYGVESFSFYFKNLLLNWNVAFPLALLCVPLMLCKYLFVNDKMPSLPCKAIYVQMGMWMWMLVFFKQKHKEERFLYPMYSLLCVNAAMSLHLLSLFGNYMLKKRKTISTSCNYFVSIILAAFAIVSLSRSLHLVFSFDAPFHAYGYLQEMIESQQNATVCVGKEWHRFPSSFFLSNAAKLGFLRSEFRGQLPKPFNTDLPIPESTRLIPTHMNDMNVEEPSRYLSMGQCTYLVDMLDEASATPLEPNYALMTDTWKIEFISDFLIHFKSKNLCRSFYTPFSRAQCYYAKYVLLSRLR
ncbi:alpha 1,2 mannosyltransferase ALG9 [Trichuris trichiura]|uniref:Mannosyltransferase n=1 Tax=Trichuris trichiura TaxID=36087 RepID=A0A077Z8G7_TRITR|nr:alpha 1,2 mannosyltransferase ALG9 [Trichuris trichiura]